MARDLVCGMEVDKRHPPARWTYKGKEYVFCCEQCKKAFQKDPEKYLRAQPKEGESEEEKE